MASQLAASGTPWQGSVGLAACCCCWACLLLLQVYKPVEESRRGGVRGSQADVVARVLMVTKQDVLAIRVFGCKWSLAVVRDCWCGPGVNQV